MPAGSRGPEGYRDYQRVVNWDSELFLPTHEFTFLKKLEQGPFNVSRYGYLAGTLQNTGAGAVTLTIDWWNNQAKEVKVGRRVIHLNELMGGNGQVRILHLGPWVTFTWNSVGTSKVAQALFSTNRYSPIEFIPAEPFLISANPVLPGAGTEVVFPNAMFAGPVAFTLVAVEAPITFALQVEIATSSFSTSRTVNAALGEVIQVTWTTPGGTWRLNLETAAKASAFILAIPAQSGAT